MSLTPDDAGLDTPRTGGTARPEDTPLYLHPETPLQADLTEHTTQVNAAARDLAARDLARREQTAAAAERVRVYLDELEHRTAGIDKDVISNLRPPVLGEISLRAADLRTLLAALNTEQENNR